METYDKYIADKYPLNETRLETESRFRMFHNIIYILTCIFTLGGAYLIRIIITEGVRHALWEIEEARYAATYYAFKKKSENEHNS